MSNEYSKILGESLHATMVALEKNYKDIVANIVKPELFENVIVPSEQLSQLSQISQIATINIKNALQQPVFSEETVKNLAELSKRIRVNHRDAMFAMTKALEQIDFSSLVQEAQKSDSEISEDDIKELFDSGDITDDDIVNEFQAQITGVENTAISSKSAKVKKVIKFIIANLLIIILTIIMNPVDETIKTKVIEELKISEFWQKTGVIDWIEDWFDSDDSAVSEEVAKASVELPESTNISKGKREDLLNKIAEIRSFIAKSEQDENTAQLMAYLGDLEKDVNGKKYGLVFEEHREAIDEVLDNYTPVLTEDEDLFIDNGGNVNFLIEGDNLASLKLLEKTHKGKIDLIYIDPPYNTLSEGFIYADNHIDKNDMFQHSKWTSLMYFRLKKAKYLLSERGSVFISIDDNEIYSLKLICDEIFGADNYVSTICVIVKPEGRRYGAFAKTHEYILVYANNIDLLEFNEIEVEGTKYSHYDEYGGFNLKGLRNRNVQAFNSTNRPNLRYPFYVDFNNPDKNGLYPVSTETLDGYEEIWASTNNGLESVWRWGKETAQKRINELVASIGKDDQVRIFQKERKLTQTAKTLWSGKEFISQKGTKEIQEILGKGVFDFPKPMELMNRVITIASQTDSIILDFFAGSGTTGHAVMKLNAEDGGNRRFILCTNNENNICRDVTYERIKRVIDKEDYQASLKYYQVQYVPIEEKMYYEYADSLLLHIRELVELENGINFNGNAEIAIVLTDEELEEFVNGICENNKCRKLYMGHDLLPDEEQDRILKDNEIEICIIPDYYYRDLQER
ncbi:MAG: site-specific DNA-methyltransferase [Eubacterium sp.]|nr:site-specific DNA-methyltransferase [Eubacterium sp.]